MTTIETTRPTTGDFKVADLSLAAFGRKEIQLAEHEMPGLMAIRREYAERQPLKRYAALEDIALAAVQLLANPSATGQALVMDGGAIMPT